MINSNLAQESINPHTISIDESAINRVNYKLSTFDWNDFPSTDGWSLGTDTFFLKELMHYWQHDFSWRRQEEKLNCLPHYIVSLEGLPVHFVHLRSTRNHNRPPLLLVHGWPGSFLEFEDAAMRLAFPENYGGDANDGYDVIIPSLPGFAFSGRPTAPISPRQIAGLFDALMTKKLGYKKYIAQGGDWGSSIASWMAHDFPNHCLAIHLNLVLLKARAAKAVTPEEHAFFDEAPSRLWPEIGYSHQQTTRPQTLAYALHDSPVGAAAWILEKFAMWSDCKDANGVRDLETVFTRDQLLTNLMLYVATGAITTSTWIYAVGAPMVAAPLERKVSVPTAVAAFPDPVFTLPPRSFAEQSYDIVRWTTQPRGGHFAAMEQPELFAADVAAFASNF